MKHAVTISIFLSMFLSVNGRILNVGRDKEFKTIRAAALVSQPGDTILVKSGNIQGGEIIENLWGTSQAWITIKAGSEGSVTISGGGSAIHLTDPRYVKIEGFIISGQTGNGINIDDGGSYETPASHIIIEDCKFGELSASGNNDQLKISGVEDFIIRNCTFSNGSKGGSMIDMVGCHNGLIEKTIFRNGGSNAVQAKGGSAEIIITRNMFIDIAERAINIGGSTGMEFFRPLGASWEATSIHVWSNIFNGSGAAVAFVGSNLCDVTNNTIINPSMWVIRILQENNNKGMEKCGNNIFTNNLILFSAKNRPAVNIGPNTLPGTFIFSSNLWCNPADSAWRGPELPVEDSNKIISPDPGFADGEYHIKKESPAAGKGAAVRMPVEDFFGVKYLKNRSVGAAEVKLAVSVER
jgi:hypothetical protein